jgi:hypothetical protein
MNWTSQRLTFGMHIYRHRHRRSFISFADPSLDWRTKERRPLSQGPYGGKSAGKDFRNHLRACMGHLNFESCLADPDVWMRPALKADGSEYYEYILIYTDDVLVVSTDGERILRDRIGRYFELKDESIGPPTIYLGGHLRQVELTTNGVKAWAFSSQRVPVCSRGGQERGTVPPLEGRQTAE